MVSKRYLTFGQGASKAEVGLKPVVKVVGVGGAGCNIVDAMVDMNLRHVEALAINTDAQNLSGLRCRKMLIGKDVTQGRGAAALPALGEAAVKADIPKVEAAIKGADVLFVICGLGGGTGTGAAPVVARLGKKHGALVVALTVFPFKAEGSTRGHMAKLGLEKLKDDADAVVVVHNDKLLEDYPDLGFKQALEVEDQLLLNPIKHITQLLTREDLPNLRKVLQMRNIAHLGFGEAKLEMGHRGAVLDAVNSLMPQAEIDAHDRAIAVIHCPPGYKDEELHRYIQELHKFIDPKAEIMWGPIIDPKLDNEVRIMMLVGKARPGPSSPPEAGAGDPPVAGGAKPSESASPEPGKDPAIG